MTPRALLQLVKDDAPLSQPEVRLMRCDACGGTSMATRVDPSSSWRMKHECRPNDRMDWRVLVIGLLGSALVVVAGAGLVALVRGLLP